VISVELETVLVLAQREAVHRRHGHLTLEHLLFAAAHHPAGEEILRACGADLDGCAPTRAAPRRSARAAPPGAEADPVQTVAFRRVLEQTILHLASAGRNEAGLGDALAALLAQPKSFAAQALESQGVTRLDVLNYISHGVAKVPGGEPARQEQAPRHAGAPDAPGPAADALAAFTVNLTERARGGALDPLVGRRPRSRGRSKCSAADARTTPSSSGGRRGQDRSRRRPRAAADRRRCARGPARRGDLRARRRGAAGRDALPWRLRGALQGPSRGARAAPEADPLRRRAAHPGRCRRRERRHDGPRKPAQAGPDAGKVRLVGSTTFEEFKQIEKDRALHRRLQKIAVEEPSAGECVQILEGCARATRSTTASPTRRRRWRRRCVWPRGTCASSASPTARST